MDIILASSSPYRKMLLDQIGLRYQSKNPLFDEEEFQKNFKYTDPKDLCEELAKQKAQSLQRDFSDHIIIGSDQIACLDQEVLGKPHTAERALQQLQKLQGQTHRLLTSYHILTPHDAYTETIETQLTMRPLNKNQIEDYIKKDSPLDCAGSYKLEKRGICLFKTIETPDHSSIIGLPLISLTSKIIEYTQKLPFQ